MANRERILSVLQALQDDGHIPSPMGAHNRAVLNTLLSCGYIRETDIDSPSGKRRVYQLTSKGKLYVDNLLGSDPKGA